LNGCNGSADAAELCVGADRAKSALSPADYLEKSSVMIVTSNKIVSSYFVGKWSVRENTGLLPHR
jgi:hypothetical protein